MKKKKGYYVLAVFIILVWSTTFVSTKTLLSVLMPVEIMFCRFIIAYIILLIAYPKIHKTKSFKEELLFIGGGLFGGSVYFLAENTALEYTLASNVGILVAAAPLFTAFTAHIFMKEEKVNKQWYMGAVIAFIGVFLVIFNGRFVLKVNPMGDLLAILAALSWAFYSIMIKKIGTSYKNIYISRKIFFYAILTMLPVLIYEKGNFGGSEFFTGKIIINLLFLGILASSICYVLWNKVIFNIGAVKANNFIYLSPLFTTIFSAIILGEKITAMAVLGSVLIIAGVYISEKKYDKIRVQGLLDYFHQLRKWNQQKMQ